MLVEVCPVNDCTLIRSAIVLDNREYLSVSEGDLEVHFWSKGKILRELNKKDISKLSYPGESLAIKEKIDYITFICRVREDDIVFSAYSIKSNKNRCCFVSVTRKKYPDYIKNFLSKCEMYYRICGYNVYWK